MKFVGFLLDTLTKKRADQEGAILRSWLLNVAIESYTPNLKGWSN